MGQYYEAVLRTNNGEFIVLNPHVFNEGAKLLEHSYINNSFVKNTLRAKHSKDIFAFKI